MMACGEVGVKAWPEDEGLGVGGESEIVACRGEE
jgi:hypothetical protein